jgi:hypothetical protein
MTASDQHQAASSRAIATSAIGFVSGVPDTHPQRVQPQATGVTTCSCCGRGTVPPVLHVPIVLPVNRPVADLDREGEPSVCGSRADTPHAGHIRESESAAISSIAVSSQFRRAVIQHGVVAGIERVPGPGLVNLCSRSHRSWFRFTPACRCSSFDSRRWAASKSPGSPRAIGQDRGPLPVRSSGSQPSVYYDDSKSCGMGAFDTSTSCAATSTGMFGKPTPRRSRMISTRFGTISIDRHYHRQPLSQWRLGRGRHRECILRIPLPGWIIEVRSKPNYRKLVGAPKYLDKLNWIIDEFDLSFNALAIASLRYHLDYSHCDNEDRREFYEELINRLSEPHTDTGGDEDDRTDRARHDFVDIMHELWS